MWPGKLVGAGLESREHDAFGLVGLMPLACELCEVKTLSCLSKAWVSGLQLESLPPHSACCACLWWHSKKWPGAWRGPV